MDMSPDGSTDLPNPPTTTPSPHGIFPACPQCEGPMQPEHAHYRCRGCGWRDSCCD